MSYHPFQRWVPTVVLPPPKPIVFYGLSFDGEQAVRYAIELLRVTLPATYAHLFREIDFITVSSICGRGTNGCTNVRGQERTIFLSYFPETMDMVELAILIGHEGLHHLTINGVDYIQPHDCRDCSDPFQRAGDWLYTWESSVRPLLQSAYDLDRYYRAA